MSDLSLGGFYGGVRKKKEKKSRSLQPHSLPQELELELIQPHMAQKPVLRGKVGCACVARGVSAGRGGMGERGCARRLGGWVWV